MIKLTNEDVNELLGLNLEAEIESEGIALANSFWRDSFGKGGLYFFTYQSPSKELDGVKFVEKNGEYIFEHVRVVLDYMDSATKEGSLVEFVKEEHILEEENDITNNLSLLFDYLSYEDNPTLFTEGIIPILLKYIDDAYYGSEGDIYQLEMFNLFILKGKSTLGYYDELVLTDIELINKNTEQVIKSFDKEHLGGTMQVSEDEEESYLMEGYLESLSEADAINIAREILA